MAPSWSWASVNQAVRYDYFTDRTGREPDIDIDPRCVVEKVNCQATLPSNPTGSLQDAYAIITGRLVCVELIVLDEKLGEAWHSESYRPNRRWTTDNETEQTVLVRAQNLWSVKVFLDRPREASIVRTLEDKDKDLDCWLRGACNKSSCCLKDEVFSKANNTSLYCLKLFSCEEDIYIGHSPKGDDDWFLVLQKSLKAENAYERIGVGVWNSRCDRRFDRKISDSFPLFEDYEIDTIKII